MMKRKSNRQEGIHEVNDKIKKTGDNKKMIVEEIMKSKKKRIKMEKSKKKRENNNKYRGFEDWNSLNCKIDKSKNQNNWQIEI